MLQTLLPDDDLIEATPPDTTDVSNEGAQMSTNCGDRARAVEPFPVLGRELDDGRADFFAAFESALSDNEKLMAPEEFLNTPPDRLRFNPSGEETVGWLSSEPDAKGVFRGFYVGILDSNGRRSVEQWANTENGAVVPSYFVSAVGD